MAKPTYEDEKKHALHELDSLRSRLILTLYNVDNVYIAVNSGRYIETPDNLPSLPALALEEIQRDMRGAKDGLARYKKACAARKDGAT